jgi:DNA-binding transcriptional LysR family regulator
MLDEASRRKAPQAMLRVGVAGEFAGRLAPRLGGLNAGAKNMTGFEVVADDSVRIAAAFRQNGLDIAFFIGDEAEAQSAKRWRAPLRWFGKAVAGSGAEPMPVALAPRGSALHEAAVGALRTSGRRFEIICMSADFAVLVGAVSAGLGLAPMVEGLAPEELKPSSDRKLPPLPPMTLTLLARSAALAESGRRWVADAVASLEPL